MELTARLEYSYQGDTWYHTVQNNTNPATLFQGHRRQATQTGAETQVDGYGITNLRIGLGTDSWKVTAFARNLFDEDYIAEVITAAEFGGSFVHPSTPRTAGVEFQYTF